MKRTRPAYPVNVAPAFVCAVTVTVNGIPGAAVGGATTANEATTPVVFG